MNVCLCMYKSERPATVAATVTTNATKRMWVPVGGSLEPLVERMGSEALAEFKIEKWKLEKYVYVVYVFSVITAFV